MPPVTSSTGIAITNPLILYRSLVATKAIEPSPSQHRLALHLQILYERLKDYEPVVQYSHRLQQIGRALGNPTEQVQPGFSDAKQPRRGSGVLSSLFEQKNERDKLALTKVLTSHEAALGLDSPRGLMLHGEVGTGKSMLIDLFADCLPNRKKKRWHFTTFMLETFSRLEHLRRSRQMIIPASLGQDEDYSLLWLAREMISTSPILFLDEFQLPDRASSKIMSNLMTSFFHLGGVLIATSNRMPEELAQAAGMEFVPPPTRMESLGWRFGLTRSATKSRSENMFSGKGELAGFLEVLKARCEVWEMEGGKDYRRSEAEISTSPKTASLEQTTSFGGLEQMSAGNIGLGYEQSTPTDKEEKGETTYSIPKNYFVKPEPSSSVSEMESWLETYNAALTKAAGGDGEQSTTITGIPWQTSTMRVYGRNVLIPRAHHGVTSWTFTELCASNLGPADYVTLASTYHTLLLTDVPVLTLLHKNEARRLITLLDALYEARCKLLVSASAGPDDLFFPEEKTNSSSASVDARNADDAVYAETFAEVYQDATAPFRPNISLYTEAQQPQTDHSHMRLHGILGGADQLEDGPPNTPARASGSVGVTYGTLGPDFARAALFTGEDERFAFKRARSRLYEMCSARWWARQDDGWWRPVDASVRRWERGVEHDDLVSRGDSTSAAAAAAAGGEGMGSSATDETRGVSSPFRVSQEPPPKFLPTHFWGMVKWGKKAGAWGQGVDGLAERKGTREEGARRDGDKLAGSDKESRP